MSYNVLIEVYVDRVLLAVMPFWDAGVVTNNGLIPQSANDIIQYAKDHLREQMRHTDTQIDGYHFVVERH